MLQVGQIAPSFTLPDASMEMMSLSSFRGKKNVVLYFYPKDGRPGCTMQAINFSDLDGEFDRHDTVVFGVSRDDVLSHAAFRDEHGLTIQLLADPDAEVCRKYHVLAQKIVDGHARDVLERSTFIIDKNGTIRHILREANPRSHAEEVLRAVREINGRAN